VVVAAAPATATRAIKTPSTLDIVTSDYKAKDINDVVYSGGIVEVKKRKKISATLPRTLLPQLCSYLNQKKRFELQTFISCSN
jgi:hypothetical protein